MQQNPFLQLQFQPPRKAWKFCPVDSWICLKRGISASQSLNPYLLAYLVAVMKTPRIEGSYCVTVPMIS